MIKMIKLVAFDWNGTIVADTVAALRANNAVLKHFGFAEMNLTQYRKHFAVPIRDYWVSLGLDANFFDQHSEEQEKVFLKNFEPEEKRVRSRAGIKELLKFLKQKRIECIVFSNHIIPHIDAQLKRLGIRSYFSKILARPLHNRDQQYKKFKDIFLAGYVRSKCLKTSEIIVIGDTTEEIEIAKKFGYRSVAITGGHNSTIRLKTARPDFLIHNLIELKQIVKYLNTVKYLSKTKS